jgi:hypothetical protein
LRTVIEPINDKEFMEFKIAALDFFDTQMAISKYLKVYHQLTSGK